MQQLMCQMYGQDVWPVKLERRRRGLVTCKRRKVMA